MSADTDHSYKDDGGQIRPVIGDYVMHEVDGWSGHDSKQYEKRDHLEEKAGNSIEQKAERYL